MMRILLVVWLLALKFVLFAQTPPVAVDDTFSVPKNSATFLTVIANDTNETGGLLSLSVATNAIHGTTVVTNGTQVIYTPVQFYFGLDSFRYRLCNNLGLCDTATVHINVTGTNEPPVAVNDDFVFEDSLTATTLDVLLNDQDFENDSLFIGAVLDTDSENILGAITMEPDGMLTFDREPLACGSKTYLYLVCDTQSCDTGEVSITIHCPDVVFLPQGFSPDGDGMNDQLVFTGIEYFAPASLKVFNQYGTIVYESGDYNNTWDGTTLHSGKPLPDGTYFYILQLADKRKYNRYLIINR